MPRRSSPWLLGVRRCAATAPNPGFHSVAGLLISRYLKMHSPISIVGVVLTGKENYLEWFRQIKNTLIFYDLWYGICDRDIEEKAKGEVQQKSSGPTKPISTKELAIWKNKDNKAYALISATVSEEVSQHIAHIYDSYGALKKLKDLYNSHSKLGLIPLLLKLFNLELKDDDPISLASEIKAIMHDINATGAKIEDLPVMVFIKAIYPTYSHYLESLQASGQMDSISFDSLVEKIAKHEKAFGRKNTTQPIGGIMCLAKKWKNQSKESFRGEGSKRRNRSGFHCDRCGRNGHEAKTCRIPWEKINYKQSYKEDKDKASNLMRDKTSKSTNYIVVHWNFGMPDSEM